VPVNYHCIIGCHFFLLDLFLLNNKIKMLLFISNDKKLWFFNLHPVSLSPPYVVKKPVVNRTIFEKNYVKNKTCILYLQSLFYAHITTIYSLAYSMRAHIHYREGPVILVKNSNIWTKIFFKNLTSYSSFSGMILYYKRSQFFILDLCSNVSKNYMILNWFSLRHLNLGYKIKAFFLKSKYFC